MTRTRTFLGLVEVANQFLADFNPPEPRAVYIFATNNAIDFIFDGDGTTADLISESLYWETHENDVTSACVTYDGANITAIVYQS